MRFLAAEAAGFDLVVTIAFGGGRLVDTFGPFVHFDLGLQHFTEACFQERQHPLELFFAQLAKDLFQLGLGLFQLANGGFLLFDGPLALGFFQLLPGGFHLLLRSLDTFACRFGRALRLLRILLLLVLRIARLAWLPFALALLFLIRLLRLSRRLRRGRVALLIVVGRAIVLFVARLVLRVVRLFLRSRRVYLRRLLARWLIFFCGRLIARRLSRLTAALIAVGRRLAIFA